MIIRWIGACCIVAGSGCIGIFHTMEHYRTVKFVRKIIIAAEYMERELRYRQLPIPELLLNTADYCGGVIKPLFTQFSKRISSQLDTDLSTAMNAVLFSFKSLPDVFSDLCRELSKSIGQFDIDGQLECLESLRTVCKAKLDALTDEQATKMRSFQTLALCTGAAVAILLI